MLRHCKCANNPFVVHVGFIVLCILFYIIVLNKVNVTAVVFLEMFFTGPNVFIELRHSTRST
jgi:hypothetical protein